MSGSTTHLPPLPGPDAGSGPVTRVSVRGAGATGPVGSAPAGSRAVPGPGRHLLALPDGIVPDEVEVLATSRFPAARWERPPRVPSSRRAAAGRGAEALATPGVLRVGRLSTLTGPYALDPRRAEALGLPEDVVVAYAVDCPRERAETPAIGGDRDGLRRAFGTAMPVREELRVVQWLVAAARRLGGAVRTDTATVLVPDMDAALDLVVLSDRRVEPSAVLAATRRVAPQAVADAPPPTPTVTPERTGAVLVARPDGGIGVADVAERRRLHAEADAFDAYMRENPPEPELFGVVVDLGADGAVAVEVAVEHELPSVLVGLPWTQGEVVAYRVTWEPPDVAELELEHPPAEHVEARSRAAAVVRSVAREIQADVGGEVADMAGFLVDPVEL